MHFRVYVQHHLQSDQLSWPQGGSQQINRLDFQQVLNQPPMPPVPSLVADNTHEWQLAKHSSYWAASQAQMPRPLMYLVRAPTNSSQLQRSKTEP